MIVFFAVVVYCLINVYAENIFELPEEMLGTWIGAPDFSVMGPFMQDSYVFSVSKATNGDYLLENNISYSGVEIGYQRFYVEGSGSSAGTLWYCGYLTNLSNNAEPTGNKVFKPLKFPDGTKNTTKNVTFCLDWDPNAFGPFKKDCAGCDCANWTISYVISTKTLISQMSMSGAENHTNSKHMWTNLQYLGPPPVVTDMPAHGVNFSCEFDKGGRDSEPVNRDYLTCPFSNLRKKETSSKPTEKVINPHRSSQSTKKTEKNEFCYEINKPLGFQIKWVLDDKNEKLRCSISVPASVEDKNTYIAIGFRPLGRNNLEDILEPLGTGYHMNFGMEGADIVVGSINKGVRTMYASLYTGPPINDDSLEISDSEVKLVNGRLELIFTRPYISGYLKNNYNIEASIISSSSDIIWAVGSDSDILSGKLGEEDGSIEYHGNKRGLRVIDWRNPEIAMVDAWKC